MAEQHQQVHTNGTSKHIATNGAPETGPTPGRSMFTEVQQEWKSTGEWVAPALKAAKAPTEQLFTAYLREFPHLSHLDSFTWLDIHDSDLLISLRALFPATGTLYNRTPGIDARDVYVKLSELQKLATNGAENAASLRVLAEYVDHRFAYVAETRATYPAGMISWHLLWSLFEVGDELETTHDVTGEPLAVVLDSWSYSQESMGRFFVLKCHHYQWAGSGFHRIPLTRKVKEFSNLVSVVELPTKPLEGEVKKTLMARGQAYLQRVEDRHVTYDGFFYTRAFSGATKLLGVGEVVIDVKSFRRCNPALDNWSDDITSSAQPSYTPRSTSGSQPVDGLAPDLVFLLPPTVHGFSLRAKRWGEFLATRLSPITWRNDAFGHLVIPPSYRRIVQALVTVHASPLKNELLTDVVEGKGDGLILALHGSPGTGKTLTAEAIAEHLRRPLYIVSAGELGLTPQALEKQLKEVLELATQWNAVLLIDEADIYLEKRSSQHLDRNALVGVFLRLLEYFTGVLILTTNSIECFDAAFMSRFALVLHFEELDSTARRTLWERFLVKARCQLAGFDLDRLSAAKLNGRDIMHSLRAAQAVALVAEEELSMAHLEEVLTLRL